MRKGENMRDGEGHGSVAAGLPRPTKEERQRTKFVAKLHGRRDDDRRSLVLNDSYGGSRTWRVVYYVDGKPRSARLARSPRRRLRRPRTWHATSTRRRRRRTGYSRVA